MKHRILCAAVLAALAFAPAACKRNRPVPVKATEEGGAAGASAVSTINMGDAKQEPQLLNGFYGIEANSWRWTAGKFSVNLRPPTGAAQSGATLKFELSVPEVIIQKLQSVNLGASINGTELAPETYAKDGAYEYKRDIPASLLSGAAVRVDFRVDKTMVPGGADNRELAIVARTVGLEAK